MDLAHNHILDSGLEGVFTTAQAFEKRESLPLVFIRMKAAVEHRS